MYVIELTESYRIFFLQHLAQNEFIRNDFHQMSNFSKSNSIISASILVRGSLTAPHFNRPQNNNNKKSKDSKLHRKKI